MVTSVLKPRSCCGRERSYRSEHKEIRYGRIPTDLVFNSEEGALGTEVVL